MIYIQASSDRLPYKEEGFSAYLGFSNLDFKCQLITIEEAILLNKKDNLNIECAVGNINFVKLFCNLLGRTFDDEFCYPWELEELYGRNIISNSIKYILKNYEYIRKPFFIKPKKLKEFDTAIITKQEDIKYLEKYKNSSSYISSVKTILSEWRCYIFNGKMVDAKCYQGDFTMMPDFSVIYKALALFKNQPVAFSIDLGINNEETFIIECNRMECLGNYGIDSTLYAQMLLANWNNWYSGKY